MDAEAAKHDRPDRRRTWALAVGVFAVGCVMGYGSLGGDFLSGDDVHLVLNHVLVNHPSPAHALELLCIVHRDLYQPIPMISFSLDFVTIGALGLTPAASGPDAGVWVFHLTNVLIHALNALLVFWLFTRVQRGHSVAVVAAVLFALHPYAAEVVAWLNGRMMLLATLFSLASLIAIDAYLRRGRWWLIVLTLLLVALAMASKVRVGLPVLMLILPLARRQWPSRRWWALWVAAAVVTAGFTALNIASTSASEMFTGAAEKLQGSRIARTVLVLAWYFQHYLVPTGMSPWHPPETMVNWSHPGIPAAIIWLVVVGAATVWSWRYTRVGVLGMLWFLATVASTLPLMPSRDVMAADRYVYLPNVGLHWMAAALLVHLVLSARHRLNTRAVAHVGCGLGVVGAAALLPYTWHVESYYLSNLAKARRIAELYPDEPGVWEDIGWAHYRAGQSAAASGQHEEAVRRYSEAIEAAKGDLERHPETQACEVYQLMGMAQYRMGLVEQGIGTLFKAIEADPDYGKCYSRLGHIYYELGRYPEAVEYYSRAVEIMPEYLPAIQAMGQLYRKTGDLDEAAEWFRRGLGLNRFDPVSTTALAEIEMTRGDTAAAIERFERLLSWQPENNPARTNLGVCYANTGRPAEAMGAYEEVLRRDPAAVTAAVNLAALKAQMGDQAGAVALVQQACRSAPTDRALLAGGHDVLVGLGRLREAAALWAEALRLEPEAADLAAWYAWTSALASQWEAAGKGAGAALSRDPGQSLALAALVLADLTADNPDRAADRLDQLLTEPTNPADTPQRLLAAITRVGQRDPENPWPYYVAARLLIAQGDTDSARLAVEEFTYRAPSPEWRSRAERLLQPVE